MVLSHLGHRVDAADVVGVLVVGFDDLVHAVPRLPARLGVLRSIVPINGLMDERWREGTSDRVTESPSKHHRERAGGRGEGRAGISNVGRTLHFAIIQILSLNINITLPKTPKRGLRPVN